MTIAILSDIHSNREALEACLAHARAQGATRHVFLGDLVGYGADPGPVVDIVREHVERGALAVRGNHDQAIDQSAGYMNDSAQRAIEYARGALTASQAVFLREMPMMVREGNCCFVHASADTPDRYPYIDCPVAAATCVAAAATAYTFVGHLHDQQLYFQVRAPAMMLFRPTPGIAVPVPAHRRWLAVVGSVGQPRDRNPQAAYALFDPARATIMFCRVAYDHAGAAARIRAAGLPESLASRVENGY